MGKKNFLSVNNKNGEPCLAIDADAIAGLLILERGLRVFLKGSDAVDFDFDHETAVRFIRGFLELTER